MNIKNIAVIGCGKLGGTMIGCFASRGFNVIGVDISEEVINRLNIGLAPAQEKGLDELISNNKSNIRGTMSYDEAISNSEISFVIVPTPSDERGSFSLQYAAHAFEQIGKALSKKNNYHVVVLTSTVLPGSTRYGLLPILEKFSGKKCGKDFGLCYSPEFIALGTVIRDFLNPDFYLIGQYDERSGTTLESVNAKVALNHAPSKRMSIENAELAKISVNSFVTLKISYANMLAEFCENLPGGDVDAVSDAIGLDKRIGRKYLTGGFGFGGPCFPRDNVALNFVGNHIGVNSTILETNDQYNRTIAPRFVNKILPILKNHKSVAVLGLAYKPLSHVIEESSGIYLCKALSEKGFRVIGYDPLARDEAKNELNGATVVTETLQQCLSEADVFLVTTPDEEFKKILPDDFIKNRDKIVIFDFWRCLPEDIKNNNKIIYIPIGKCTNEEYAVQKLSGLWKGGFEIR
jgi:UDPglucose 6-dehydrogenase